MTSPQTILVALSGAFFCARSDIHLNGLLASLCCLKLEILLSMTQHAYTTHEITSSSYYR